MFGCLTTGPARLLEGAFPIPEAAPATRTGTAETDQHAAQKVISPRPSLQWPNVTANIRPT